MKVVGGFQRIARTPGRRGRRGTLASPGTNSSGGPGRTGHEPPDLEGSPRHRAPPARLGAPRSGSTGGSLPRGRFTACLVKASVTSRTSCARRRGPQHPLQTCSEHAGSGGVLHVVELLSRVLRSLEPGGGLRGLCFCYGRVRGRAQRHRPGHRAGTAVQSPRSARPTREAACCQSRSDVPSQLQLRLQRFRDRHGGPRRQLTAVGG